MSVATATGTLQLRHLTVPADGTVAMVCGPNANPWLVLLYIRLWRNRYLWLRPAAA